MIEELLNLIFPGWVLLKKKLELLMTFPGKWEPMQLATHTPFFVYRLWDREFGSDNPFLSKYPTKTSTSNLFTPNKVRQS